MSREQEPAAIARERATTSSGNSMKLLQTNRKRNRPQSDHKARYDPKTTIVSLSANVHVFTTFLNQYIRTVPIKTPGPRSMTLHIQKEIIHYNEMK
jgi:hypothetical protein